MPARLAHPDPGVGLDKFSVGGNRHRADKFPGSGIVIETHQRALRAGQRFFARRGIGKIGETHRDWPVEIGRSVGLNCDDQRELQSGRQRFGQTPGRNRCDPDPTTAGPVVRKEGICRHHDLHVRESRIGR